jgi:uncharacterized RDD family membrane protein YckC
MEENLPREEEQHLFDSTPLYTEASSGSRFFNFLIDNLFMRFILGYATGYVLGTLLAEIAPEFLFNVVYGDKGLDYFLFLLIAGYLNYLVYYIFCEAAFKGYTLGKAITGTKAIRNDGQPLTFKDAVKRSLCRIVPFEVFSALGGTPWHDRWTDTMVIKSR